MELEVAGASGAGRVTIPADAVARRVLAMPKNLGVILAALGARRIDVLWIGKAGTFGLLVAFPLFLASHSTVGWHHTAGTLAWICAVPGLLFSYYAAITYIPLARQALADGRAEGRVGSSP